ncbi:MAG: hypothetical protein N3B21_12125 [Clostridia bacterium]|nr:hypothetical protein [Clostridia bacterium]
MQLQSLMMILFMMVIIPVMMLFSNHNLFFVVLAAVLFFSSLRNLTAKVFSVTGAPDDSDDSLYQELEDMVNIDVHKFGKGAKVAKDLIIIVFFTYCIFYIDSFFLKLLTLVAILYWIRSIVINISVRLDTSIHDSIVKINKLFYIFINVATMILIVLVSWNKFVNSTF